MKYIFLKVNHYSNSNLLTGELLTRRVRHINIKYIGSLLNQIFQFGIWDGMHGIQY